MTIPDCLSNYNYKKEKRKEFNSFDILECKYRFCQFVSYASREQERSTACLIGDTEHSVHSVETNTRLSVKELDPKKLKSLQMKYITIPDENLAYFPKPVAIGLNDDASEGECGGVNAAAPVSVALTPTVLADDASVGAQRKRVRAEDEVATGVRKRPGPKPKNVLPADFMTLFQYYSKIMF